MLFDFFGLLIKKKGFKLQILKLLSISGLDNTQRAFQKLIPHYDSFDCFPDIFFKHWCMSRWELPHEQLCDVPPMPYFETKTIEWFINEIIKQRNE